MKIAEPPENNHPGLPVGSEGTEEFSKDTVTSIRFPVFHCWELTCLFTPVLPRLNPTSQHRSKRRTKQNTQGTQCTFSSQLFPMLQDQESRTLAVCWQTEELLIKKKSQYFFGLFSFSFYGIQETDPQVSSDSTRGCNAF